MLEFKELTLADRERIAEQLSLYPPRVSEQTFTNLWAWRTLHKPFVAQMDGTLFFAVDSGEGMKLQGPPAGDMPAAEWLEALNEAGVPSGDRLDCPTARALKASGVPVESDRDNSDYVYLVEELATLEGRVFHRKKNMVNRCLSSYPCEYEPVTPDNAAEVAEMQERWGDARNCEDDRVLCAEHNAIMDALEHFEEFGLMGGAVRIKGRIEAFTLGERLNEDTAVVHFEKAMTQYTGLYQLINYWFCGHELGDFEFVNREQDLGIRGLRKAKKSYNPHHMVKKYAANWEPVGARPRCRCDLRGRCVVHGTDGGDHA